MMLSDYTRLRKQKFRRKNKSVYLEEQAIAHLHDVGLVHSSDSFPVVQVGIAKSILCCPSGLLCSDDLDGLNDIGHHFVFQPAVLSLCVLSASNKTPCSADFLTGIFAECMVRSYRASSDDMQTSLLHLCRSSLGTTARTVCSLRSPTTLHKKNSMII